MDIKGSVGVPNGREDANGRDKLNPAWLEKFVRLSGDIEGCNEDLKPGLMEEFALIVLK
jgi:hypothetical protein